MKASRKATVKQPPAVAKPHRAPAPTVERVRAWLLAALAALVVARPLLPSEGVAWMGDDLPFDMLALCLAAGCLALTAARGSLVRPLSLADGALAGLVLICITSAIVGGNYASPRPAINMLWQWVGAGLVFFLTRQLVRTERETRALVSAMLAVAVVASAYGYYQVFVSLPADRAAYAANPDDVLRAAGQWSPPGSPERLQFEDRLASSEPLATFALTNSLAGFLAPWLVIGLGIALTRFEAGRDATHTPAIAGWERWIRVAGAGLCLVFVAGCLVLTKSRSAYLAVALGLVLLPLFVESIRRRVLRPRFLLIAGGVVVALVIAAVAVRGLDREVLSEAGKSLGYRVQYWGSTLTMIMRYPWLGVGPGNFQDYYTQFKLPEASEEIRDPHNFLLEIWATAGTFAMIALADLIGVVAWRTRQLPASAQAVNALADSSSSAPFVLIGGGLGFLLAFVLAPSAGLNIPELLLFAALAIAGAVAWLAWPWIDAGTLPARLPALGALVLAVNLLAAGGIAYPGVAGTFWVLLALALNAADDAEADRAPRALTGGWRIAPAVLGVAAVAALVACYVVAYGPVTLVQAALVRAETERTADARVNALLDAAAADPLSAEPWAEIGAIELERLKTDPKSAASRERFMMAATRMVELRPRSSATCRLAASWYTQLFAVEQDPSLAKVAVKLFQRAVELYPTLPALRAEYALSLEQVGQPREAREQIHVALELDAKTPHPDKKLSPELRARLAALQERLR